MNLLNEIMSRYPTAISFAPGAPNPILSASFNVTYYIDVYLKYLRTAHGLSEDESQRVLKEYGPSRGLINSLVKRALRTDYGLDVPERGIIITVGAQEALFLALRVLFASQTDTLAVVTPCYVGVLGAANLLNIPIIALREECEAVDFRGLSEAIGVSRAQGTRIKALYVAPDFANPSGTVMSLTTRRRLLEVAEAEELIILEDIAYGFTAIPGSELPPLKVLDRSHRVVMIGTFAKVCIPGARVGFAVADQPVEMECGASLLLAEMLASAKSMISVNTSPISQGIVAGMLLENDISLASLGKEACKLYQENLKHLLALLEQEVSNVTGVSWTRPTGGFFVRMGLPIRADRDLLEYCASMFGVLWTPMADFYLDSTGDREIRLSCSYLTAEQMEIGVKRLGDFVRSI